MLCNKDRNSWVSVCCISVSFRLLATVSLKVSPPGPVWEEWVKSPRISPSSCGQRNSQITATTAPRDCCTTNIKNEPALPLAQCCSLHEKSVQQQFRQAARSDDFTVKFYFHPHYSTQTSLFFRASGVQRSAS